MSKFKFNAGTFVTDKMSGLCGHINSRVIWSSGAVQYSIQPQSKEGGPLPDSWWTDCDFFEESEDKSFETAYGEPSFLFEMSAKVKSIQAPYEGFIHGQCQCLNGCIRYLVISHKLDKYGKQVSQWFDETGLKLIKPPKKEHTQVPRKSGGPASKVDLGLPG